MLIPTKRDLEITRRQLTQWLAAKLPAEASPELSALEIPQGSGHSNETLLFDVNLREAGRVRQRRLVARVQPAGRSVFPEYDMALQFRCMQILGERTEIPVPKVLWLEQDPKVLGQPFYVMERVTGLVPTDNPPYAAVGWLAEASHQEQKKLVCDSIALLARLHQLDWRSLGFGFLDRPRYGTTGFAQQLAYYEEFLSFASGGSAPPEILSATLRWLNEERPAHRERVVLNWGDARIGNMMYLDFKPVAVLDWEMATLGPAEVDLAWFIYMNRFLTEGIGLPGLPGHPSRKEIGSLYESLTGERVRELRYYEVWAAFRFAVVMLSINQMMIEWGIATPSAGLHELAIRLLNTVRESP
jgi:aminoglycoside phosphotransferase (APT) family kinase protein